MALLDESADLPDVIISVNWLTSIVNEAPITSTAFSSINAIDCQLAVLHSQVTQLQADFSALFDAIKKGEM